MIKTLWLFPLLLFTCFAIYAQPGDPAWIKAPEIPDGVSVKRDIAYVSGGHRRQVLDLYRPEGIKGPLPVIVWIHGGGWTRGDKRSCLILSWELVQRGYAIASINYRFSRHAVFPAQLEDCKSAIRWLRAHAEEFDLDSTRLAVCGGSAGGHLAALLGTTSNIEAFDAGENLDQSSEVKAVVNFFGPSDFIAYATTPGYERSFRPNSPNERLIGGNILENRDQARRASPIHYVTKDDSPMLLIHGEKDRTVPIQQSQLIFNSLRQAGVSSHFHTVLGDEHLGCTGPEVIAIVQAFFDRHLMSKPFRFEALQKPTSESAAVTMSTQ